MLKFSLVTLMKALMQVLVCKCLEFCSKSLPDNWIASICVASIKVVKPSRGNQIEAQNHGFFLRRNLANVNEP